MGVDRRTLNLDPPSPFQRNSSKLVTVCQAMNHWRCFSMLPQSSLYLVPPAYIAIVSIIKIHQSPPFQLVYVTYCLLAPYLFTEHTVSLDIAYPHQKILERLSFFILKLMFR
ncbi:hypothetical protein K445DRAFT_128373 [Daldinia sp. EC12]|nr:hypothetical protein K445DRAFT_128373 [Daldinia sp. EC12]